MPGGAEPPRRRGRGFRESARKRAAKAPFLVAFWEHLSITGENLCLHLLSVAVYLGHIPMHARREKPCEALTLRHYIDWGMP
jgi:hypothetical protein